MNVSRSDGDASDKCSINPALSRSDNNDSRGKALSRAKRADLSRKAIVDLSAVGSGDFTVGGAGLCRGTVIRFELSFAKDGIRTGLESFGCDESPPPPHPDNNMPSSSNSNSNSGWQHRAANLEAWGATQMQQYPELFSTVMP
jgi:hypothetical protein